MSRDPHMSEREMMVPVPTENGQHEIMAPGLSIKFSKTRGAVGKVPAAGEHTCEILGQLPGMTPDKIEDLRARGRSLVSLFQFAHNKSQWNQSKTSAPSSASVRPSTPRTRVAVSFPSF